MIQQLTKGCNNTEYNVKVSKLSSSLYAVANDVASSLGEVPVAPVLGSPPWAGGIVPVLGNNLRHPSSDFCGTTLPRFESNPAVCVYNKLMYLFHLRHHQHTLSWSPPALKTSVQLTINNHSDTAQCTCFVVFVFRGIRGLTSKQQKFCIKTFLTMY